MHNYVLDLRPVICLSITGLIPDGSNKVAWRWEGQVFEDSPDDVLQHSIVVRNLQELGVDSIEALKYLFPQKTDEERAAMLSGFPFRVVGQVQQSLNSFIGLLGNLYQLPHPQTPDLPLASDPNLDITGFLYRSLEFLRKELSYSGSYKPDTDSIKPPSLSESDRVRPAVAPQYASSPGQASPALNLQPPMAAAPQAQAPIYQQAVAPQASAAQAGNPWQQAFQALSQSLNTSNLSPAPAQYSAYQTATPTPQAVQQASWGSQVNSAAPISNPQVSTQGYSETQVEQLVDRAIQHGASQAQDAYLSQVSDESLEVLQHFGAEAPYLLNQYACAVEDALIEQVQRGQSQSLLLEAAGEERAAMNLMLTDPDILADYVNDFYGPEGPYPTPTQEELAMLEQQAAQEQFAQEIYEQEVNTVPQNFQRPQQNMARNMQSQVHSNSGVPLVS